MTSAHVSSTLLKEKSASIHIPYTHHHDEHTIVMKKGCLLQILSLEGYDFDTKSWEDLNYQKRLKNTLLLGISDASIAIYIHTIRREQFSYPDGNYENQFAREFVNKYREKIKERRFLENNIYISVIKKKESMKFHSLRDLSNLFSINKHKEAETVERIKEVTELYKTTDKIISTLEAYRPRRLGLIESIGRKISEPITLLSYLVNLEPTEQVLPQSDLSLYIPRNRHFFAKRKGIIQVTTIEGKYKHAAILSIKEYPEYTHAGILDTFATLPIEYVITQSFQFENKVKAQRELREQKDRLRQSDDKAVTQREEIEEAMDDLASGKVAYGKHHLSILCLADTIEGLDKAIAKIHATCINLGILCVREDIGCEETFWAQLPGNFGYIFRKSILSTKNIAAFASLHNFPKGKKTGNHWGSAVTVIETMSHSAYHFNFHVRDVGNSIFIGPMGRGKTLLMSALMTCTLKFGGPRIALDTDRGMEIAVRMLGGDYQQLIPGQRTGFNFLQLNDTHEDKIFMSLLLRRMLTLSGNKLSPDEIQQITRAINGVLQLPYQDRRLSNLAHFLGPKKSDSLRLCLSEWIEGGDYAWLFDNEEDTFNIDTNIFGLDIGKLLKDSYCSVPALMYVFHRIGLLFDGSPGAVFIPEGWKPLSDPFFKEQIKEWSKTPRKKNFLMAMDTQNPEELAENSAGRSVVQESVTQIYFANPTAKRKHYRDVFGLTEREYELVRDLPEEGHYFLLKHGRQSLVARMNLTGMEDEIAVLSGRKSTISLLDILRSQYGDHPDQWAKPFYAHWRTADVYVKQHESKNKR